MDVLVALAISIGILIAGWTYVALGVAALPVWAGIVAWGCFFAAGGKTTGLTKTIASNLSGVVWAFLALEASREFGGGITILSVLVGVAAFFMVLQAKISAPVVHPGRLPRRGDSGERGGRSRNRRVSPPVDEDDRRAGGRSGVGLRLGNAGGQQSRGERGRRRPCLSGGRNKIRSLLGLRIFLLWSFPPLTRRPGPDLPAP